MYSAASCSGLLAVAYKTALGPKLPQTIRNYETNTSKSDIRNCAVACVWLCIVFRVRNIGASWAWPRVPYSV